MEEYVKNELVIVTAFFDIGRESFLVYPRTKSEYFSYFRFWAGIQNRLIVFCDKNDEAQIRLIRKQCGVADDKTTIIPIDDIYGIEPEIYKRMREIQQLDAFHDFRYYKTACSNMANYNYVMLLKYYFLARAAESCRLERENNLVWIDFGFNHGGRYYLNPEDFKFEWKWKFNGNIELFCLSNPDHMPVIDSLQFQKDCIQGTVVGCKKDSAGLLWKWMKEAMDVLLSIECMDDDQHLLLMVYKAHRKECHITLCDWYQPIEMCTDYQFRTDEKQINMTIKHDRKQLENFLERCKDRVEKYY